LAAANGRRAKRLNPSILDVLCMPVHFFTARSTGMCTVKYAKAAGKRSRGRTEIVCDYEYDPR
jgi:hypothetical protein